MIELRNLNKAYEELIAVKDLTISVSPGTIFGFLGPNGAGKTTTIKMMVGLLKPTSGSAIMGGYDIEKEPVDAKRQIGYVPDEPFLYEKLSGREFLEFVCDLWRMDTKKRDKNIEKYLKVFNLSEKADYFIQSYSHGMRQKIALAAALIHEPKILLLDEPTVGLDPQSAKLMKNMLRNFRDNGGTVFLSTHILEIAERLCDKVGIINKGNLITVGSLEELRCKTGQADESLEDIFMELTDESSKIKESANA